VTREPITFTQAMLADLEIRQGALRGDVAARLLPDTSRPQAAAVLRDALKRHGMWQVNPGRNSRAAG
jgi:hypothetical protein